MGPNNNVQLNTVRKLARIQPNQITNLTELQGIVAQNTNKDFNQDNRQQDVLIEVLVCILCHNTLKFCEVCYLVWLNSGQFSDSIQLYIIIRQRRQKPCNKWT